MIDASTLGKIDIAGTRRAEFLNRVYTNAWDKLARRPLPLRVMLREDGMVIDDGVTARLARRHFLMTTTTGGAARVLHMARGLAADRVARARGLAHVGHRAMGDRRPSRARQRARCWRTSASGIDLSPGAFPYMVVRARARSPAFRRACSASASPASSPTRSTCRRDYGRALWEALIAAGAEYGITPYGTESDARAARREGLHHRRPGDRRHGDAARSRHGLDRGQKKPTSSASARSRARDTARAGPQAARRPPDRGPGRVLNGRRPDRRRRARAARPDAHADARPRHVELLQPELKRSIALAVVRDGIKRRSEEGVKAGRDVLYAFAGGKSHKVKVVSPVFVDPEGARQNV